jgi:hypothetical protein
MIYTVLNSVAVIRAARIVFLKLPRMRMRRNGTSAGHANADMPGLGKERKRKTADRQDNSTHPMPCNMKSELPVFLDV